MPCTLVCLTPVVIAAWPAIASFAVSAAAALGFTAVASGKVEEETKTGINTAEVELEGSSLLEAYTGREEQFIKDGIRITVKVNQNGRIIVRVKGKESQEFLKQKAEDFAGKFLQAYSYHKAMSQLRKTGFIVVDENVQADQQIHITLRRF